MSAEKNWQFELEEYIKQGEPGQISLLAAEFDECRTVRDLSLMQAD